MAVVNTKRVLLGALLGSIVWFVWSGIINFSVLAPRYAAGQEAGLFLKEPRYPFFVGQWFVLLFLLSWIGACIYSGVRATYGPGPKTALKVGVMLGFAAGFPISFSIRDMVADGSCLSALVDA